MGKRFSLADSTTIKRIEAGGGFDEWFDVLMRPTTGMVMAASDVESNGERGIRLAVAFVQAWSLQDDAGAALPVTVETMRKLPVEMIQPLLAHLGEVMSFLQTAQK